MSTQALSLETARRSGLRAVLSVAALLLGVPPALAQRGDDGLDARGRSAYAQWRKLAQSEVNCINDALRSQHTTLWRLIQRGIEPSSGAVAEIRAGCRGLARTKPSQMSDRSAALALATAAPKPAVAAAPTTNAAASTTEPKPAAMVRTETVKSVAESTVAKAAVVTPAVSAPLVFAEPINASEPLTLGAVEPLAARRAMANLALAEKATIPNVAPSSALRAVEAVAAAPVVPPASDTLKPLAKIETSERPPPMKSVALDSPMSERSPEPLLDRSLIVVAATEARTSFIYGLVTGPLLLALGGLACLVVQRRRSKPERFGPAIGEDHEWKTAPANGADTATVADAKQPSRAASA